MAHAPTEGFQIRWTAVDAHLDARPVKITYQQPPSETWQPVTEGLLANTGRYDWPLPTGLSGSVAIRLCVTDRGNHEACSERQVLEVEPGISTQPLGETAGGMPASLGVEGFETVALPGSAKARETAERLYAEAVAYGARGEYGDALGGRPIYLYNNSIGGIGRGMGGAEEEEPVLNQL